RGTRSPKLFSRGILDRRLRRESTVGLRSAEKNAQRLQRVIDRVVHGGRFIAAMRHTVRTFRIVAGAVRVPIGLFEQCFEARRVAFVDEQIARPLPAEYVARRIAPRRAAIGLIAGEKVEIQARVVERPPTPLAEAEKISEKLLARVALNEKILARRVLVAEARRNRHSLDPERGYVVEKLRDLLRRFTLKQRAVDRHSKVARKRLPNSFHRLLVDAGSAD